MRKYDRERRKDENFYFCIYILMRSIFYGLFFLRNDELLQIVCASISIKIISKVHTTHNFVPPHKSISNAPRKSSFFLFFPFAFHLNEKYLSHMANAQIHSHLWKWAEKWNSKDTKWTENIRRIGRAACIRFLICENGNDLNLLAEKHIFHSLFDGFGVTFGSSRTSTSIITYYIREAFHFISMNRKPEKRTIKIGKRKEKKTYKFGMLRWCLFSWPLLYNNTHFHMNCPLLFSMKRKNGQK